MDVFYKLNGTTSNTFTIGKNGSRFILNPTVEFSLLSPLPLTNTSNGVSLILISGEAGSSTGNSGTISINTPNTNDGTTGNINLFTGTPSSGNNNSGEINLITGFSSGSGIPGNISLSPGSTNTLTISPSQLRFGTTTSVSEYKNFYTISTTNATPTNIAVLPSITNKGYLVEAKIVGRRTNGTNETATYIRTARYTNNAGTLSIANLATTYTGEAVAAYNATLIASGTNIVAQVTGVAGHNIDWVCILNYIII